MSPFQKIVQKEVLRIEGDCQNNGDPQVYIGFESGSKICFGLSTSNGWKKWEQSIDGVH